MFTQQLCEKQTIFYSIYLAFSKKFELITFVNTSCCC